MWNDPKPTKCSTFNIKLNPVQKTIISTPFPYAYSIPHLGNITQAIKGDLYTKLRNALNKHQYIDTKTLFCYSFHATGLPVYFRIQEMRKLLKSNTKGVQLDVVGFKKDIFEYFRSKNILPLLSYVKKVKHCTTLKGWVEIMSAFYTDLFIDLGVHTNLPKYHTTTDIDTGYSNFVKLIYKELFSRGLIVEDKNYLIYCNKCSSVLGDHDRVKEEGIGVTHHQVYKTIIKQGVWYHDDIQNQKWVQVNPKLFISEKIYFKIRAGIPPASEGLLYDTETRHVRYLPLVQGGLNLTLENPCWIYSTSAGITCRCGGSSTLGSEKTLFIKFTDLDWKLLATQSIQRSHLPAGSKKALLQTLTKLRNVAFLRSFGYGTKLKFLPAPYNEKIVDSLMDSALHPYYYAYFLDSITKPTDFQKAQSVKYLAHMTGKDLLPTHLLYMHLFSSLLTPNVKVPYFETTRFICASSKEKMSKSLNNVVYWADLKEFCTPMGLKSYISTLADTDQATAYDKQTLIQAQRNTQKHRRALKKYIKSGHVNNETVPHLREIFNQVSCCVGAGPYPQFKLRKAYHLIHHKLADILSRTSPGSGGTYPLQESLIDELLNCFN